ncbi:MAG TPA: ABC transporter permease [Thermoanaerobaculia bacterium]|nr:ABC transporter permease [Thermoanaerobaculia bacterium]
MSPWLQDARQAARGLAKSPGFTAVALATLAIGIGANAAIFSVVDAVLIRPLPYSDSARLVVVGDRGPDGMADNVGYKTFEDLRDRNTTFEAMAAVRSWNPTLIADGRAERIPAMRVTWRYFSVLGLPPVLGRDFRPEDDRPEGRRVLLLSDALWRRRFGADTAIVGKSVRLNDGDFRVIGVLPPDYQGFYNRAAQAFAPVGYRGDMPYACRSCQHLKALGRISRGVTLERANADLDRFRRELAASYPQEYPKGTMAAVPLAREVTGDARAPVAVLFGAVGFVLLIACANVANLLLTRSLGRSRELAVRAALGASRGRLVRQLLTESLVLCAVGGALGAGVGVFLHDALVRLAPAGLLRLDQSRIDGRVLAFVVGASAAATLLAGLLPALRASAAGIGRGLVTATRASAGLSSSRARRVLAAVELSLAVVLLAGAALMVRSVSRLLDAPVGFDANGVLTLGLSLDGPAYDDNDPALRAFQDRLLARVRALPGVERAALTGQVPLGGNGDAAGFHIAGRSAANPSDDPSAERYSVTPDYLRAMGIPLLRGRGIVERDRADSEPVLLVSRSATLAFWGGADPIGSRVRVGDPDSGPWRTVVGVVGDVRHFDAASPSRPQMYLPQSQATDSLLVLVVRSPGASTATLADAVRAAVRELDPTVPIYDVATTRELVDRSAAPRRFVMKLLAAFAAAALLLAALGIYGVVSHAVGQRKREIGIRVALGATPRDIRRLVLSSGAAVVGAGLAAGIVAALAVARLMRSVLYEVSPRDPLALTLAAATLAAVALAAHWLPARRAARVAPIEALREE